MVFNATFKNITAIPWQSVLLVEKTGVPREKHWPVASHWLKLVMKSFDKWIILSSNLIGLFVFKHLFEGLDAW